MTPTPPKAFISYSHDSPAHLDRILSLSNRLRADGINCIIDQYEQSPSIGWPTWCDKEIEQSTFVLVACTDTYLRRFKKEEIPHKGLGVTWEGHIISQELYNAQGRNDKFIPIIFSDADFPSIPLVLQSASYYQVADSYEQLLRRLTNQPSIIMPPVGAVKPMPAREPLSPQPTLARKQDFQTAWQLPYPRNPFFTGRETVLARLHESLTQTRRAALSGLQGQGKTQTSIEYAYRHRSAYKAIFFVKAETRETLLPDLAQIATTLNLPSANAQEQEVTVAEVKRWLETSADWLLILDNANDLTLAQQFLPSTSSGHILFTTNLHALGPLAQVITIDDMLPEEGANLLLRRAQLLDRAADADRALATQISRELGGLPLALDQAGAFIEETPSTLTEYLDLYRQLLSERGAVGDHASVSATFSLAFEKVEANSPAAADLIRLCAFLAPEAIPEEIITTGAEYLGEHLGHAARNPVTLLAVFREATRYSLLDRDPDTKSLDIHRLAQIVIKDGMSDSEQRAWAERAVSAVAEAFPDGEFQNWGLCQRLLPHAESCANLIQQFDFASEEAALLLNQEALYLDSRALFPAAEPLYRKSLVIYEAVLGQSHTKVATLLSNLANLFGDQGNYAEAEQLHQRAITIRENALGPEHRDVATSLNNLAWLYTKQRKFLQAEPLHKRSLSILESKYPDDPRVASSLSNLASAYNNLGKYDAAEPLLQRSLAIREKALGPAHPGVGYSLNNLAMLYHDLGRHAEAESLSRRALTIWENSLGPDHPDTAIARKNLALILKAQSDPTP